MTAVDKAFASVATAPAAYGQERLLFLDRLTAGHPFFHTPVALDVRGELDRRRLRAAVTALAERHEALRTTLHVTGAGAVQIVHATPEIGWTEIGISLPDATAQLPDWCMEEIVRSARAPIRLDEMPVYSCHVFMLGPERAVILLRLHHIATDAWSINVLLRDLEGLYNDLELNRPEQFRLFAEEQRKAQGGLRWQADAAYWQKQVTGVDPVIEVPTDFPRPPVAQHAGAIESAVLPAGLIRSAEHEATRLRVTPMSCYLAAWATVLADLTGRETFLVGTGFANRESRFRSTVGFFANQLPLRLTVPPGGPAADLVRDVSRQVLQAHEHAAYPFEALVRDAGGSRELSRSPFVQVGFNFAVGRAAPVFSLGAARAEQLFLDCRTSRVDLVLGVLREGNSGTSVLWYDTALYTILTARDLLRRYSDALGAIMSRSGQS